MTTPTHPIDVRPPLAAAFRRFDDDAVRWALLRGLDELDRADGDVDLLVHPADLGRCEAGLRRSGYVRLPAPGRGSHRFWFTYDAAADAWVKLDIVSVVAFGPFLELASGAAFPMLERRTAIGPVWHLSGDDAFWHLLLHQLLDRPADIPPARRSSLVELAIDARIDGPLARAVSGVYPALPSILLGAVATSDWTRVEAAGTLLRDRWRRSSPITTGTKMILALVGRRLPTQASDRLGYAFSVVAPDGAEDEHLTDALLAHLPFVTAHIRSTRAPGGRAAALRRAALVAYHRGRGRLVAVDPACRSGGRTFADLVIPVGHDGSPTLNRPLARRDAMSLLWQGWMRGSHAFFKSVS